MKRILIDMTHITPDKLYASLSIYIFRILDAIPVTERKNFVLLVPSELEDFTQQRYPDYSYILFPASPKTRFPNNKLIRITRQIQVYKKIVNSSNCDILFYCQRLIPLHLHKNKPEENSSYTRTLKLSKKILGHW